MQKVDGQMPLHLVCINNHDVGVLILFMVLNLLFASLALFGFKDHEFVQIYMIFCNYVISCESWMYKGHEGTNVKACNEFGNDPMKMCYEHKTRMKVDHRIEYIKLCFYQVDCDL